MTNIMIFVGIPGPRIWVNIAMVFMGIPRSHYNVVTWTGVAQNKGIRKITGVFRTTPTAITENMIGIAPIKYLLPRILHSFRNRMTATNPHHILHTLLTEDQCAYWRVTPPTNLTSLLHDLGPSTDTPISPIPWASHNVSFSSPYPPPQSTTLFYVPSTVDDTHVIHLASRTHLVFTLLRSFTSLDHTQALGMAVLSALRDFPSISSHFIHTPSFKLKLISRKPHRDSGLFSSIRDAIDSSPSTSISFHQYYSRSKDSPKSIQRRLWNQRFSASPHPITIPPPTPRELMWQNIKEEYNPFNHPSAIACQIPDNGKPVTAIQGALKTHSRIITSTIFRIATGHCFDATYSQRFRPQADDILSCPHTHTHPHLHTRHHIIFQCAHYTKERRKFLPRPWRLPVILQSEDASERLGLFLKESNCTLLRPIPTPLPIHTRSNSTPLNPDPP